MNTANVASENVVWTRLANDTNKQKQIKFGECLLLLVQMLLSFTFLSKEEQICLFFYVNMKLDLSC